MCFSVLQYSIHKKIKKNKISKNSSFKCFTNLIYKRLYNELHRYYNRYWKLLINRLCKTSKIKMMGTIHYKFS